MDQNFLNSFCQLRRVFVGDCISSCAFRKLTVKALPPSVNYGQTLTHSLSVDQAKGFYVRRHDKNIGTAQEFDNFCLGTAVVVLKKICFFYNGKVFFIQNCSHYNQMNI